MHIALSRNEIGQNPQIGESARISGLGRIAANPLEMIALKVELAGVQ